MLVFICKARFACLSAASSEFRKKEDEKKTLRLRPERTFIFSRFIASFQVHTLADKINGKFVYLRKTLTWIIILFSHEWIGRQSYCKELKGKIMRQSCRRDCAQTCFCFCESNLFILSVFYTSAKEINWGLVDESDLESQSNHLFSLENALCDEITWEKCSWKNVHVNRMAK